jgi:alpha-glucosidase
MRIHTEREHLINSHQAPCFLSHTSWAPPEIIMRVVGEALLESTNAHGALLRVSGGHTLQITALEEDMVRVRIDRDGRRSLAHSWMVSPAMGDPSCGGSSANAPYEGRDKDDLSGFALVHVDIEKTDAELRISTSRLRVIVPLGVSPLALRWEWRDVAAGCWRPLMADRRSGAYYFGRHQNPRLSHHIKRRRGDRFYGLGEKSGALNKAGGRYRMDCVDAMGYDAERSDPLYKFWPFYIAKPAPLSAPPLHSTPAGECEETAGSIARAPTAAAYGLFYDNPATCAIDLGCTFDNYHGLFSSYEATCGDLDYTVLLGPTVRAITCRFAWLIGGHCLPPVWSLGYSGSTMSYTDAPDAQQRMKAFIELLAAHGVPCSSFQMSSGYTSIGSKRYVFNWNRDKFPAPAELVSAYAAAGLHLAANIKPCLLTDHPLYAECRAAGLFLTDSEAAAQSRDGGGRCASGSMGDQPHAPETSMFWDAVGSHLDFTNPATAAWWRAQVTEKLLRVGIGSTWNDNNEWHVDDESATCHGFGTATPLRLLRPVQALLMVRASLEAQRAHAPHERPWLISRSGMPGTQRYAQTWSGDNYTSWHTLKWNVQMGLSLSLSGFFNTGHDVGGFAGPQPEPELLVRWVQNGVFHPRFTIHSWNTGVCEPPGPRPATGKGLTPPLRLASPVRACALPSSTKSGPPPW